MLLQQVWFFFPLHSQYREAFLCLCCLRVTDGEVEEVKLHQTRFSEDPCAQSAHQLIIFAD